MIRARSSREKNFIYFCNASIDNDVLVCLFHHSLSSSSSSTNWEKKREREPIFFLKYCFVIGNSIKLQKLILEREIGLVMNNNVKFGNEPIYFGAKFHTIVKFLGKKDCDKFNV
jgi:hypothetical protein